MARWWLCLIGFFCWALPVMKIGSRCIAQGSKSVGWCFAQRVICNFTLQTTTVRTKCWLKFSLVATVWPGHGFLIRTGGTRAQGQRTDRSRLWWFMSRSRWLMLIACRSNCGSTCALAELWSLWEGLGGEPNRWPGICVFMCPFRKAPLIINMKIL